MTSLNYALIQNATQYGDRTAFIFDDQSTSYQELHDQVSRMASVLSEKGLKKGDHIALLLGNSPEFVITLYACWRVGATVIPMNPGYTKSEIQYILENAKVKVIVAAPSLKPMIDELRPEIRTLQEVLITEPAEFWNILREGDSGFQGSEVGKDDVAVILYTSGTTGKPKGAMLTHGNLYSNAVATGEAVGITRDDVIITVLPMFHIFAMTVCLNMPIVNAAKMVIMRQFSPREFVHQVRKHEVTFFGGVPTMYNFLYHYLQESREDFSTVTRCASGGASLPLAVLENFEKDYHVTIQEGYGITEGAGVVTLNPRNRGIKAGTVGVPIGGIEVKIVDLEGNEVPTGEVGELICKGPNVFVGYFEMPEATAQTLKDGWLYTGDLAVADEDGYIRIVDRKKDMIIVGGYNVYPREVEEVLFKHEKVVEAGVVGEPDDQYGEKVVAFVVTKGEISEKELLDYCRLHLAKYKVPAQIIFKSELPKTSTGKVLRRALRSN